MKTTLHLRPVYHRLEDRIRAHIIRCWLALLLVRLVETMTRDDVCVFCVRVEVAAIRHDRAG
jgi:transposase